MVEEDVLVESESEEGAELDKRSQHLNFSSTLLRNKQRDLVKFYLGK